MLSVIPDVTFSNCHDNGVYQLQTFQCQNSYLPSTLMEGSTNDFLVTAFKTVVGEMDQVVFLWKHTSLSAAFNFSTQQQNRKFIITVTCFSDLNMDCFVYRRRVCSNQERLFQNLVTLLSFSFTIVDVKMIELHNTSRIHCHQSLQPV